MKYLIIALLFLGACTHAPTAPKPDIVAAPQKVWAPESFVSHPDWLGFNLDPQPIEQIRKQLEAIRGGPLKNRGEAHITVITPPEFKVLAPHLSMEEIESLAASMGLQQTTWKPICIAQASNPKNSEETTYFVVIEAAGLQDIRTEIFRRFTMHGGDPLQFKIADFYPHITVGYTLRDLHAADGIIKDHRYCSFDLVSPEGEPLTRWNW